MATKKSPATKETETEEQLLEQPAEAQEKDPELEKTLKAQQAEIAALKAKLEQMANNPPVNQRDDAATVKQAAREAAIAGVDPWTIKINVRAPRRPGKEDPWYWINVNGLSVQLPADDKYHEMKLPWAEALINSLEAEKMASDFQDKMEVYDPITNPHRD